MTKCIAVDTRFLKVCDGVAIATTKGNDNGYATQADDWNVCTEGV